MTSDSTATTDMAEFAGSGVAMLFIETDADRCDMISHSLTSFLHASSVARSCNSHSNDVHGEEMVVASKVSEEQIIDSTGF